MEPMQQHSSDYYKLIDKIGAYQKRKREKIEHVKSSSVEDKLKALDSIVGLNDDFTDEQQQQFEEAIKRRPWRSVDE